MLPSTPYYEIEEGNRIAKLYSVQPQSPFPTASFEMHSSLAGQGVESSFSSISHGSTEHSIDLNKASHMYDVSLMIKYRELLSSM